MSTIPRSQFPHTHFSEKRPLLLAVQRFWRAVFLRDSTHTLILPTSVRCGFFTLGLLGVAVSASAQILPDATLPENTVVDVDGDFFEITGGTAAGGNLFHSFEAFSIPTNSAAFFNNAADIDNIISRVTGGSLSNLDGLIQANGTASFFLINPNGIVFGPNARLEIGGSFFGSTASGINFDDGTEFSATNPQNPLLTVNVPIGLQYGTNAADIQLNNARLTVEAGETLALAGGNVMLDNAILSAPGGRIELGGLLGVGEIALDEAGGFSFPDGVVRGNLSLANRSSVDVANDGDGSITLHGANIALSEQITLSAGIAEDLGFPGAVAGDIVVNATGAVSLDGSRIRNNISTNAIGDGGDIDITANSLSLTNNADLDAEVLGMGNAGNIFVEVTENVTVQNSRIFSDASSGVGNSEDGNSGEIFIAANGSISITENSVISSDAFNPNAIASGIAGSIDLVGNTGVTITDSTLTSDSQSTDDLQVGNISLIASEGSVNVTLNSDTSDPPNRISTTNFGSGFAGDIFIDARDNVIISNSRLDSNGEIGEISIGSELAPNSIEIQNTTLSTTNRNLGTAGNIFVNARDRITISENSNLFSDSMMGEDFGAGGAAGSIEIIAPNGVEILNSTIASNSASNDNLQFGLIRILAETGSVNIDLNSETSNPPNQITTSNFGLGFAGDVSIDARDEVKISNSQINSNGEIGQILIGSQLTPNTLDIQNATLSTTNQNSGTAGNILVNAGDRITISSGSNLFSDSRFGETFAGEGTAGSIDIYAPNGVEFLNSTISSESASNRRELGLSNISITASEGSVNINLNSQNSDPQNKISTTNFGAGFAGNIFVDARDEVAINDSTLSSNGVLGQLVIGPDIKPQNIDIRNTSLSTTNVNFGEAGSITLNADDRITLSDNSNLLSDTFNSQESGNGGIAGGISIVAPNTIEISESRITSESDNDLDSDVVGNIAIRSFSDAVNLDDVTVSTTNFGSGIAGDIEVVSQTLDLNDSTLEANSSGGNGGSITVTTRDLAQLRNRSRLATNAGTEREPGSGGQIRVNSQFLIGSGNSDITANAFEGAGGEITINGDGIFGLAVREQLTSRNDITAISQTNPSLGGTIAINSPEVDASGLVTLSESPVDVTALVGEDLCSQGEGSEFVITGRGGLPPNPGDVLTSEPNVLEWTTRDGNSRAQTSTPLLRRIPQNSPSQDSSSQDSPSQLIEATGWVLDENGNVVLVAEASKVTLSNPAFVQGECHQERRR